MRVVVCVKPTPEESELTINPETGTLEREAGNLIINPFDLYAVEEAIRAGERNEGVNTTAIAMAPPKGEGALREALALGCNRAILLTDKRFAGADTLATSHTLSGAIRKLGFDLIICGMKSTDGDTAQVGPGIAEFLGIPHVSWVSSILELGRKIVVKQMLEDCYRDIEVELPCLITVTKEINDPRLPSFKDKLRAKKATLETWRLEDLGMKEENFGLKGSPTKVVKVGHPSYKKVVKFSDEVGLVDKLKEWRILEWC